MILRLILGDQLNSNHSWFKNVDNNILYILMEVRQETDYVTHHIQKVLAFFASMREFAKELTAQGHRIIYIHLNDPNNKQRIPENLNAVIKKENIQQFEYLLPDEFRLDQQLKSYCKSLSIPTQVFDSEHFLTERLDVKQFFEHKKQYVLESFYRHMRKKHGVLLEQGKPVGGKWNYDQENRNKYDGEVPIPEPFTFQNDVSELIRIVRKAKVETIGKIDGNHLIWSVNRKQALQLLSFFIKECLPHFGTYQDAMTSNYWTLFHSRLSFALNIKMLHPMEVIEAALAATEKNPSKINLAQLEGFVRQLLGWREYMRGIYWAFMPDYSEMNFFNHQRKLPHYYWDGETKMACMKHAIGQSLKYAYAHHIQRLMITGNFALLAGIHPNEVDTWYLGIYLDAIEWVEITNTRGMSQFADGGIVATKPYVSSANYIQKMSDYCSNCFYNFKKKYGDKACPFNSLYWAFYERHRTVLSKNPRIGMMYRVWDRFDDTEKLKIINQAKNYLEKLEDL